jgi:hypothetical protein
LHRRNREGPFDPVHGCTSAPHLESTIGSAATHTALNAQPASARQEAAGTASLHTPNLDTFQTIGGLALQSLAQLDKTLPVKFKSWQPMEISSPQNILALSSMLSGVGQR